MDFSLSPIGIKKLLLYKCGKYKEGKNIMIEDMKVINEILKDVPLPKMVKVQQLFADDRIKNVSEETRKVLEKNQKIISCIKPGMSIAITCGSRGIANLPFILKEVVQFIKDNGGKPFIVPAMGSHGGATAEGQKELVEKKGVTEEYCECPIVSSMDVVEIGKTNKGESVFIDKHAALADGIIVVGRIKSHTDFSGKYESGLLKMMAVGLGNQKGAASVHNKGPDFMAEQVEEMGKTILKNAHILFGIGLVENAYEKTKIIRALSKEEILNEEPKLLKIAYKSMARILFDKIDLLIVDEIGKEISGIGADSNITGRFATNCIKEGILKTSKLILLDLTEKTEGSAVGVGLGDIITKKLFNKIDFEKTYTNSITTTVLNGSNIPMVMENDMQAIKLGIYSSNCEDMNKVKIVRIKNTMELSEMFISEALLMEINQNTSIKVIENPKEMLFDNNCNLLSNI